MTKEFIDYYSKNILAESTLKKGVLDFILKSLGRLLFVLALREIVVNRVDGRINNIGFKCEDKIFNISKIISELSSNIS